MKRNRDCFDNKSQSKSCTCLFHTFCAFLKCKLKISSNFRWFFGDSDRYLNSGFRYFQHQRTKTGLVLPMQFPNGNLNFRSLWVQVVQLHMLSITWKQGVTVVNPHFPSSLSQSTMTKRQNNRFLESESWGPCQNDRAQKGLVVWESWTISALR